MNIDGIEVIENPNPKQLVTLEEARGFWSKIAKENGWYNEPFHVQAWIDEDGTLDDCVSFKGLSRDIVLPKRVDEDDWERYDQ